MQLVHPLTGIKSEAVINKNNSGEYTKIKFNDGYIINDENYIYDILLESGTITTEEYNNKHWELIREYIAEI